MVCGIVRVVMVGSKVRMIMVVPAALVTLRAAKFHLTCKGIGEMNVVAGVFDAIQQ